MKFTLALSDVTVVVIQLPSRPPIKQAVVADGTNLKLSSSWSNIYEVKSKHTTNDYGSTQPKRAWQSRLNKQQVTVVTLDG
jgi:hypothetical protein